MLSREKQAVQVFRRVRDFLTERAPTVGYGSVAKVVDQLTGVIDKLETFAREQDARARQALSGTRRKRAQVAAIRREFLRPISRAVRTIFPADAPLQAALTMPQVRDYQGTIAAAEAMAQTASANKARFVEVGFPDDFVERMQAAATALRAGIDTHAQEFGRRSASTAGLRREYARGRDLVRMLDAMVAPRLEATPDRFAEWLTISHFARLTSPPKVPDTVPPIAGGSTVTPVPNASEPGASSSGSAARAA